MATNIYLETSQPAVEFAGQILTKKNLVVKGAVDFSGASSVTLPAGVSSGTLIVAELGVGAVAALGSLTKPITIQANASNDYLQLRSNAGTDKWHVTGATSLLFVESGVSNRAQFTVGGGMVLTTSNANNALTVGANGATNPVLNVNSGTASVATGVNIVGAAAGGGLAISTISSDTDENLTIDGKGAGSITMNSAVVAAAGGKASSGVMYGSIGVGVFTGTGAPSFSAMNGSIYTDSNATTTTTRIYVNKSGAGTAGTTWTNLTTAA